MDLLALQAGLGIGGVVVGLLVLVLAIVTVYQMVEIVDAYEKKALTVFGEFRRLLEPGINFIPPQDYRYRVVEDFSRKVIAKM